MKKLAKEGPRALTNAAPSTCLKCLPSEVTRRTSSKHSLNRSQKILRVMPSGSRPLYLSSIDSIFIISTAGTIVNKIVTSNDTKYWSSSRQIKLSLFSKGAQEVLKCGSFETNCSN